MRKVRNGLHHALEFVALHFVEKQRQQNGRWKRKNQAIKTDEERVADESAAIDRREKPFKMLQAHPFGGKDALNAQKRLVILEGDHNAEHGHVLVYDIIQNGQRKQQIKKFIPL